MALPAPSSCSILCAPMVVHFLCYVDLSVCWHLGCHHCCHPDGERSSCRKRQWRHYTPSMARCFPSSNILAGWTEFRATHLHAIQLLHAVAGPWCAALDLVEVPVGSRVVEVKEPHLTTEPVCSGGQAGRSYSGSAVEPQVLCFALARQGSSLTACRHQALAAVSPLAGPVKMPGCTYTHEPQNQCTN